MALSRAYLQRPSIEVSIEQQETHQESDSEREFFYDDILHVQASAYAH